MENKRMCKADFLKELSRQLEYYQFKLLDFKLTVLQRKVITERIRHLRGAYLSIEREI